MPTSMTPVGSAWHFLSSLLLTVFAFEARPMRFIEVAGGMISQQLQSNTGGLTVIYNVTALLVLLLGFAASVVSGRVTLLWDRGGLFHEIDRRTNVVWSVIGALAFPAQLALVASAFFVVWWPLAIVFLLAFAVIWGLVVTRDTLPLFTALQPALNVITIAAAVGVVWMLVA
jgi:hypothetical protein